MLTSSMLTGSSATSSCGSQGQRGGDDHALALPARQLEREAVQVGLRWRHAGLGQRLAAPAQRSSAAVPATPWTRSGSATMSRTCIRGFSDS